MRTLLALLALATPLYAHPPVIEGVEISPTGSACLVGVTLSHGDTGWDHYADGWRIEDADGHVLGTRVLAHPHVHEQPFKRCLAGVVFPEGTTEVFVRAKCSVDGWNAETLRVEIDPN